MGQNGPISAQIMAPSARLSGGVPPRPLCAPAYSHCSFIMAAIQNQLAAYGSFLTTTLRPRLQAAVAAREETEGEIAEYATLRGQLLQVEEEFGYPSEAPTKEMNALVDLAHGAVYCSAKIPNPRTVYVNVGFGFHVEMTLPEAIAFIDRRIDYLERDVLKHRSEAAATIAKDVERALELLEEAGGELKEADRG